jgi:hypothetical protein
MRAELCLAYGKTASAGYYDRVHSDPISGRDIGGAAAAGVTVSNLLAICCMRVAGDDGKVKPEHFLLHLTLSSLILGVTAVATLPAFAESTASGDFRGAVEVDGSKIHLECTGDGEPVTVEPGPGLTSVFTGVAGFTRSSTPTI